MAHLGLLIASCSTACSQQPAQPVAKSRFTQEGLDTISTSCGLKRGSLVPEGLSGIRFGTGVASDYKLLNCVQTKIRETYYPNAKDSIGAQSSQSEASNAQTR